MRGFLAVPLGSLDKMFPVLEQINREYERTAKSVSPEQIHITLRFFGNIDDITASRITQAMEKINFQPFRVRAESVGQFPSRGLANVLYIKVYSPEIYVLEKTVSKALFLEGIPEEKKPFVPHITISRFRKPADLKNIMVRFGNEKFTDEVCKRLIFFKSELTSGGPHYEIIKEIQLK